MAFLYGETSSRETSTLDAHLLSCAECRGKVDAWRGSMKALDQWTLPELRGTPRVSVMLKWAAAAAIILSVGFGLGRSFSPGYGDLKDLRSSLEKEFSQKFATVRADLTEDLKRQQNEALQKVIAAAGESASGETQRLLKEFARASDEAGRPDSEAILAALKDLDTKWSGRYVSLRKELETVAVLTEDGLEDTQQQLKHLYTFAQANDWK